MVRRTDVSEGAAGAEPGTQAPVPERRAVLKAAASAPVILTLLAGPARAGYDPQTGMYEAGMSFEPECEVPPPDPPRYNPEDCDHPA
jgi:hypothetical protein